METVALVEDIVVESITDLVHKAQDVGSKRGKLLTGDFLYLIRKTPAMETLDVIDKSWIHFKFPNAHFIDGVKKFIEFAKRHHRNKEVIPCACARCRGGGIPLPHDTVVQHCYKYGFDTTYTCWFSHGEKVVENQNVERETTFPCMDDGMDMGAAALNTVVEGLSVDNFDTILESNPNQDNIIDDVDFTKNLREAMSELYPGCTDFTVLRFVVKMFDLKIKHGLTNQYFTEMLQLLQMVFPAGNKVPDNTYQADKIICDLGLKYEKIHACRNDCILYWGNHKTKQKCPTCNAPRYKIPSIEERKMKTRSPAKVLRYFPLTDRLKRLYSVDWVAKEMCWHSTGNSKPGKLGHPVDLTVWKQVDLMYPTFSAEPRNVRLGLATDGFNPFSNMSTSYSSWPVMLVVYNLPPWLCMKPQFTMLTTLIEGPRQPGKDIDIYFQPLIKELNDLWRVTRVKDACRGDVFNMRDVLLWTIHDFPAYGNVSGCKTKGKYACPPCGLITHSLRLHHRKKHVYMRHRHWYPLLHEIRKDVREGTFDKTQETEAQPLRLTGVEVENMTKNLKMQWGKGVKEKQSIGEIDEDQDNVGDSCFYKRSIFFDLPYWKHIPVRHNLDVMHIEKNVCEILLSMMLNTKGKTKDDINARKDLKHLKIKKRYWLRKVNGKMKMQPGIFCLQKEEKKLFLETLRNLSVPVGFSSNWSRIMKSDSMDLKGMKSHDHHIIMQHLLPTLIQHAYQDPQRKAARSLLVSICTFFGALCSKSIDVEALNVLERNMVTTLCALERVCPPSLFVVMMHLPIHLAYEARMCGPVWSRWMYTFERMMHTYKGYVSNKSRPEGCIAERYLREETLLFCSGYKGGGGILERLDKKADNLSTHLLDVFDGLSENSIDNDDGFVCVGQSYSLEGVEYEQVQNWVLKSHPSYESWHTKYTIARAVSRRRKESLLEFIPWLKKQPKFRQSEDVEFKDVVRGPTCFATKYTKYCVNGFFFIANDYLEFKMNQNSGVSTSCMTNFRSSARDKNPVHDDAQYYGVLRKIIEVKYREGSKSVLFKCDWVKYTQGVKMDEEANLRLVNLSNLSTSDRLNDEPFIMAENATQVFYSKDPKAVEWHVVLEVPKKVYFEHDETCLLSDERSVNDLNVGPSNIASAMDVKLIYRNPNDMVEATPVTRKRKRARRNGKNWKITLVVFMGDKLLCGLFRVANSVLLGRFGFCVAGNAIKNWRANQSRITFHQI